MKQPNSEKKAKQIAEYESQPYRVGDRVYVRKCDLNTYSSNTSLVLCEIKSLDPVTVCELGYKDSKEIDVSCIQKKCTYTIGAYPFIDSNDRVRSVAFTLESIINSITMERDYDIGGIPINSVSWNPYVYSDDGSKNYYQRGFVWTLENKQNLIESIYNHVDCGKVLIRKLTWDELEYRQNKGETELAFREIVDGKQRLHTIIEFINDEFPDKFGNYFSDLSNLAQHKFLDHQLIGYSEMENISDKDILAQFLKMNFEGVPQSTAHLDYVRSLFSETT